MTRKQKIIAVSLVAVLLVGVVASKAATVDVNFNDMSSYLNKDGFNLGIRNNNPGNIKMSQKAYFGKIAHSENQDGTHEQFETLEYGLAAMITHLQKRYFGGALGVTNCAGQTIPAVKDTIDKILKTWACSDYDNNPTAQYIAFVENKSGFNRNEVLDPLSKSQMHKLCYAMALYECGTKYRTSILSPTNFSRSFEIAWIVKNYN